MPFRRSSKTLRSRRYFDLRDKHFTPRESQEFSKLTRKYPALQRLVASRTALWANFVQESRRKGWESEARRKQEWSKKIVNFYERQRIKRRQDKDTGLTIETLSNWVVKKDVHGRTYKVPKISPWEWYDDVFQKLPPEIKWDTPRGHRIKQPDVVIPKIEKQRQAQQWIAELRQTIAREPHRREELEKQIRRLGGRP